MRRGEQRALPCTGEQSTARTGELDEQRGEHGASYAQARAQGTSARRAHREQAGLSAQGSTTRWPWRMPGRAASRKLSRAEAWARNPGRAQGAEEMGVRDPAS
jgi:hypothetical protein